MYTFVPNKAFDSLVEISQTNFTNKPRERTHVKGYGFLSFARNIGTHATKVAKNMNNKYGQKLVDTAQKSATDAIKTASKRAIQKTAEATRDLVGNKFADKIKVASKKTLKKPRNEESSPIIDQLGLI